MRAVVRRPRGLTVALASVAGASARVVAGTPRADRLVGTPRADVIRGLAAAAIQLVGLAGADFLQGGPGATCIAAGAGNDRIATSYDGARDTVRCGPGADVVNADADRHGRDATASSSGAGSRATRTRPRDAQHETEVEPDSFTVGPDDGGRVPGRPAERGRRHEHRVRGHDERRRHLAERTPARPHRRQPSRRHQPARERPGRRLRRSARDLARLDARARRTAYAARDQPLARRRRPGAARPSRPRRAAAAATRASRSTRTGSAATTRRARRSTDGATSSYTHSADEDMLQVRWTVDGGQTWSPGVDVGARPAVGVFPAVRPTGELVVVYLWETSQARSPRRVRRTAAPRGRRRFASPTSTAAAGSAGSARFRCRRRTWTRPDGSGPTWHDCTAPGASTSSAFVASSADGSAWSARRRGDARSRCAAPCDRHRPRDGTDRGRVHAVGPGRHRRRARRVDERRRRWGAPRRLSAQSMPLAVDADDDLGPHARRLHLRALRPRPPARRVGAGDGTRRLELPAGRLRDARVAAPRAGRRRSRRSARTRRARSLERRPRQGPIGCQTVFSSRNASISHGLCASADERTTRLTFSAAVRSSSSLPRRCP